MKARYPKKYLFLAHWLAIATMLIAGCARSQSPPVELEVGFTHQEVRDTLGEPDETQEFVMPDGPFFGPQEALSGLVPAGSLVEEWRYDLDDEKVRCVWFYGDSAAGREAGRMIATSIVPKDAVY